MKKVLVIDDDEGVRLTLHHILKGGGYAVAVASDGVQGLELLRSHAPEIVITDILMPKHDGVETILQIRRENSTLKIVAMSGGARKDGRDIADAALLAGADAFLEKPFDVQSVWRVLG